ncbi:MAG: type II secretion system F family protein [Lactobacillaceae bacterium]|jgi:competence protein ComGB|nr:type II secretion system F family protein [Lactobacillaceae bacterium]
MWHKKRWSHHQQAQFFEIMGDLVGAGYSLSEALNTAESALPSRKRDLLHINQQLSQGVTIEAALDGYFDKHIQLQLSFIALHGELTRVLQEIGKHEFERYRQQQQVQSLLLYPFMMLLLTGGIGFFMWRYLGPQIAEFSNTSAAPAQTDLTWLMYVGIVLVVFFAGIFWLARLPTMQRWLILTKIPLVRKVVQTFIGYFICLHMGLLLQSGISLAELVKHTGKRKGDSLIVNFGRLANQKLAEGQTIMAFVQAVPLLPSECQLLFKSGKQQQQLGLDLEKLAQLKQIQMKRIVGRLVALIQPLAFCVIGGVVVYMYAKFMLPMYSSMGDMQSW